MTTQWLICELTNSYMSSFVSDDLILSGCAYKSIMMDGSSLYPKGFHPVLTDFTPDCNKEAKPYARSTALKPVRYYFVDFGISRMCSKDGNRNVLITGTDGPDATVPELSNRVPYDPYQADIYILGNFLKQYIYNVSQFCGNPCSFVMLIINIEVLQRRDLGSLCPDDDGA